MSTTYYHGSHRNAFTAHFGLCLTEDRDVAESYAQGGTVYAIEIDTSKLLTTEIAGYDRDNNDAPGDHDPEALSAELGVHAITFEDEDLHGRCHDTLRLLSQRALDAIMSVHISEEDF